MKAKGYRLINIDCIKQLHEAGIHKFNNSGDDFRTGFWNGYCCAIKAVMEKLESVA